MKKSSATTRVLTVEDRLMQTEQTLALVAMLAQGVPCAELSLSERDNHAAWAAISTLAERGLEHLRGVTSALGLGELDRPAPSLKVIAE